MRGATTYRHKQPIAITTKCAVVNKSLLWLAFRFRTFTLANTATLYSHGVLLWLWLAFRFRTFTLYFFDEATTFKLWLAFRFRTFTLANTAGKKRRRSWSVLWLAFRFRTFTLANTAATRWHCTTRMLWLAFRFRTFTLANTAKHSNEPRAY